MRKKQRKMIVNTQDLELSVGDKDASGGVRLHVRIGENGMGYSRSTSTTFRLDPERTQILIDELQAALDS